MSRSKVKKLSTLFKSAVSATTTAVKSEASSSSSASASTKLRISLWDTENDPDVSHLIYQSLHDDSTNHDVPSLLRGLTSLKVADDLSDSKVADDKDRVDNASNLSWYSNLFGNSTSLRRKELCRERKGKWIYKNTQKHRFDKLVSMCLEQLGTNSTIDALYKLGRGSGLKEYGALIRGCIKTARSSKDERTQVEQILEVYRVFQLMKEQGFPMEEDTFGPLFLILIDLHMTDHFFLFLEIVKDEDTSLHPRLGYYEMMLYIEMNNEEKVQELCNDIATGECEMGSLIHENYLLALCERDRKQELCQLLETIDITRVSSLDSITCIFKSLGRLSLETFAEMFIGLLKDCDHKPQIISNLIYDYTTSMKSIPVENVITKFKGMHVRLDVELLHDSYEKLIKFCCDSHKAHLALDILDEMCEAGLSLSPEMLNSICRACEETSEYILARRIHSMLHHHKLKANSETFRIIINLNVRMKDFDNAYAMFNDLEKFGLTPTASMYNALIAGYYREKNVNGVVKALEKMKQADLKPDSQTFSFLISNSAREEDIMKYLDELKRNGVHVTKYILMSLINAFAACGQYEKAKQVVADKGVSTKNLYELKSVLICALASHGQLSDALDIYKGIKQSDGPLEPKAAISLIEHLQSEGELGELSILLQLLEELKDPYYWIDGCCRVILYCVRNRDLRSSVDLLEKLADYFQDDELGREVVFDEVFSHIADMDPPDLQFGLNLLEAIKNDLTISPSRKCMDFLLSAGVNAKDMQGFLSVWKEYEIAGLPYNIMSNLRMYQILLATGRFEAARQFLKQLSKDDPHVLLIIQACDATYGKPNEKKNKKRKKKK